jgi:hypothetical protein
MRCRLAAVLGTIVLAAATTASAQAFDFEAVPVGTTVPLSITSGGLGATFTSGAGFSVQSASFLSTLTGNVLRDFDAVRSPLTITFSAPLTGISLRFATNDLLGTTGLTLQARDGAALVGSVRVPGVVPDGWLYPEGVIGFAGPTFTSVVLSSTAPDFAVDQIVVAQVGVVPEPGTVALVGTGVVLVAGTAARRRRTPSASNPD